MVNNKEREELLLLAQYQLRLNVWKEKVAELEREIGQKLLAETNEM